MKKYKARVPVKDIMLDIRVNDLVRFEYGLLVCNARIIDIDRLASMGLLTLMHDTGITEEVHIDRCYVEQDAILVEDIKSFVKKTINEI